MSNATDERDRVLGEVAHAHADAIAAGLGVLERWAGTGERFSANDVRAELRDKGVTAAASGALFGAAIRAGLLRKVGYVASTDLRTHSKPVMQYIGAQVPVATLREAVTVPVMRDPAGRFTQPDPGDAPTLFEVSA